MSQEMKEFRRRVQKILSEFQDTINRNVVAFNRIHNVQNAIIRTFCNVGIEQGWWKSMEEFQERFAKATVELYREAKEYEQSELKRMMAEKKEGGTDNVVPFRPHRDETARLIEAGNEAVNREFPLPDTNKPE